MTDKYRFEKGDWVQGRSREGELIHGFIEILDSNREFIKVNVVECDNEKAVGKKIWIPSKWTEKLPDIEISDESHLLSLIDFALFSKDEPWFMELSTKLIAAKNKSKLHSKRNDFPITRNRIENLDVNK